MCRFLAYHGDPVYLDELVCAPTHSLVHQSLHATEAQTETNGDGFGIGWYGDRPEPGLYRDVRPAWSDENLRSLSRQIRARTFFAMSAPRPAPRPPGPTATPSPMAATCSCITARSAAMRASAGGSRR